MCKFKIECFQYAEGIAATIERMHDQEAWNPVVNIPPEGGATNRVCILFKRG
jgi:hypothetical protein